MADQVWIVYKCRHGWSVRSDVTIDMADVAAFSRLSDLMTWLRSNLLVADQDRPERNPKRSPAEDERLLAIAAQLRQRTPLLQEIPQYDRDLIGMAADGLEKLVERGGSHG